MDFDTRAHILLNVISIQIPKNFAVWVRRKIKVCASALSIFKHEYLRSRGASKWLANDWQA